MAIRRRHSNPLGLGGPEPIAHTRPKTPHPLRRAVIAVLLALLVVAWFRYDPLAAPGAATECPPQATVVPAVRFSDADAAQFPDRSGICVVRNVNGTRATVSVVVRNEGPVGVDVTGARLSNVPGVFAVERVAVGPAGAASSRGLQPLDGSAPVPGGAARLVAVTVTLPRCEGVDRGQVVTLEALPLRASVLGLPRDVDVRLDPVVRLQAEGCPP